MPDSSEKDSSEDIKKEAPQKQESLSDFLLQNLICPLTHEILRYDTEKEELVSRGAGLAYPVRNGIPIMLPESARKLKSSDSHNNVDSRGKS